MEKKEFEKRIKEIKKAIKETLIEKNKKYGDSALNPLGAFFKGSSGDSIMIRLDDKIKRVLNSNEPRKNDLFDIIGYLILLNISKFNETSKRDVYFMHKPKENFESFPQAAEFGIDMLMLDSFDLWEKYEALAGEDECSTFMSVFTSYIAELVGGAEVTTSYVSSIAKACAFHFVYNNITNFTDQID